jgi:hypothetical protein
MGRGNSHRYDPVISCYLRHLAEGGVTHDANEPRLPKGLWQIVRLSFGAALFFSGGYLLHTSDVRSTALLKMKTSQTLRRTSTHGPQTTE